MNEPRKKKVMIYVDEDCWKQLKALGYNLSWKCQQLIRWFLRDPEKHNKLILPMVPINERTTKET